MVLVHVGVVDRRGSYSCMVCSARGEVLALRNRMKQFFAASDYLIIFTDRHDTESSDLVIFVMTDDKRTEPIALPLAHARGEISMSGNSALTVYLQLDRLWEEIVFTTHSHSLAEKGNGKLG